jgi:phage-related protein
MKVLHGRIKRIGAVFETRVGLVVSVDALAEQVLEAVDGCAVDEVEEMLLRRARGLQDGFDGRVSQDSESGLQAGIRGVEIVEEGLDGHYLRII